MCALALDRRFRGKGRYDSLTYPQWNNGVKLSASGKRLLLSKVGDVEIIFTSPTFDSNRRLPLALNLTPFSHCGYVSESYRPWPRKRG